MKSKKLNPIGKIGLLVTSVAAFIAVDRAQVDATESMPVENEGITFALAEDPDSSGNDVATEQPATVKFALEDDAKENPTPMANEGITFAFDESIDSSNSNIETKEPIEQPVTVKFALEGNAATTTNSFLNQTAEANSTSQSSSDCDENDADTTLATICKNIKKTFSIAVEGLTGQKIN